MPEALEAVLIDLGGVVYVGDQPIEGALEALARLRRAGLGLRFLTNTTRRPKGRLLADLAAMGLALEPEELMTPAGLAVDWLRERRLRPHLLVHPALEEEFSALPARGDPAAVIGDAGEGFTYPRLNAAFRLLMQGAPFVALARNRRFLDRDGEPSLDAGAFVAALEYGAGREALVLGKPAAAFFELALRDLGAKPARAVMIGDDAEADIGGAMAAGLAGVLVRTGKYAAGDEEALPRPPDHVAADLPAAADWILERSA